MRLHTTLLSASTLARHLEDPKLVIVDCRFSLTAPEQGQKDYAAGHIPRAVYAHLDNDLAGPIAASSGRHPLPDPADFQATLRRWGVCDDSQVVVYDDASGGIAARLWWMLRWLGHEAVALLDGGFAAWCRADLPVTQDTAQPAPGTFSGTPNAQRVIEVGALQEALNDPGYRLVDARDAARFRGEVEPIDPVAGHVPGAVNLPFSESLSADGSWRSASELRDHWRTVGVGDAGEWAVMCGSGVTACHLALAAEVCQLPPPRLYVGSWSEWLREPARGVARDEDGAA